ncbi:hypothetical protein CUJ84_Chr001506 [Rhizobium leguminosarum]|uniref:Uncharacterized protein n=1 Tax=Rhizobium leguminosarum TaxID=384 RepID=A0A2K9Z0Z1_RHILE|nr:hypothetical protein CUJ84_Chr001506 [Rhizobium leguminosarum]
MRDLLYERYRHKPIPRLRLRNISRSNGANVSKIGLSAPHSPLPPRFIRTVTSKPRPRPPPI